MWYNGGLVIVIVIKWETKNITSSEQFLNPIGNGGKSLTLTHIFMTAHSLGMVQTLQ
jgi:hypothetical protein